MTSKTVMMVMTRRGIVLLALALLAGAAGCNKADEGDCRKAVMRIRELTGTSNIQAGDDVESAVRSCRGNASKESVRCAMEAASVDELERCGLLGKEEIEAIKADQEAERRRQEAMRKKMAPAVDAGAAAPVVDAGAGPADAGAGAATGAGAGTATGAGAGTATGAATGAGTGTGTATGTGTGTDAATGTGTGSGATK
jgi:hypothetical protein